MNLTLLGFAQPVTSSGKDQVLSLPRHRRKGVGSLFMTRVSGIETRAVCPAAPALQLEILRIMS